MSSLSLRAKSTSPGSCDRKAALRNRWTEGETSPSKVATSVSDRPWLPSGGKGNRPTETKVLLVADSVTCHHSLNWRRHRSGALARHNRCDRRIRSRGWPPGLPTFARFRPMIGGCLLSRLSTLWRSAASLITAIGREVGQAAGWSARDTGWGG